MQLISEITYPVRLSSAELFVLLALVSAPTLLGAEVESPRSISSERGQLLWEQGTADLRANGWLVYDEVTQTDVVNETLLLLLLNAVNAEVVLLTTWDQSNGTHHGVAHYDHGQTLVEMSIVDGVHEFVMFAQRTDGLLRIARRLDPKLPLNAESIQFQLTHEQAAMAKQNPDVHLLQSFGLSEIAAQQFAGTLQKPRLYGSINLLRSEATEVIVNRIIGIVLAETSAWLAFVGSVDNIDYYHVSEADFIQLLDQEMTKLAEIKVVYAE
ncbi:hypothetical protein [Herpetosiphon giganteus]|uniref:hypothetical protein n=1 Tax=Herpetosiphon giganteus TaxID=2029754 RepID=UPI00195B1F0D|nr:hypothetical protein [Herpetosiphon giganteus]MBM7843851.1 archaellum component FlaF (FlaF/FlaG flagellin family) [Herpetosiphon giganteus]